MPVHVVRHPLVQHKLGVMRQHDVSANCTMSNKLFKAAIAGVWGEGEPEK